MKAWGGWALVLVGLVLVYLVDCVRWPQRDCRWCKGRGVHRSDSDHTLSRRCWWCKGAPKRDRIATRLWRRHRQRKTRRAAS